MIFYKLHSPTNSVKHWRTKLSVETIKTNAVKTGSRKVTGNKVKNILKPHGAINTKRWRHLEDRAKLSEIETIISTDPLKLLVLLCSIIMQQYTLQCTIHRDSSATLPLPPPNQHHISDVAIRRFGRGVGTETVSTSFKVLWLFILVASVTSVVKLRCSSSD